MRSRFSTRWPPAGTRADFKRLGEGGRSVSTCSSSQPANRMIECFVPFVYPSRRNQWSGAASRRMNPLASGLLPRARARGSGDVFAVHGAGSFHLPMTISTTVNTREKSTKPATSRMTSQRFHARSRRRNSARATFIVAQAYCGLPASCAVAVLEFSAAMSSASSSFVIASRSFSVWQPAPHYRVVSLCLFAWSAGRLVQECFNRFDACPHVRDRDLVPGGAFAAGDVGVSYGFETVQKGLLQEFVFVPKILGQLCSGVVYANPDGVSSVGSPSSSGSSLVSMTGVGCFRWNAHLSESFSTTVPHSPLQVGSLHRDQPSCSRHSPIRGCSPPGCAAPTWIQIQRWTIVQRATTPQRFQSVDKRGGRSLAYEGAEELRGDRCSVCDLVQQLFEEMRFRLAAPARSRAELSSKTLSKPFEPSGWVGTGTGGSIELPKASPELKPSDEPSPELWVIPSPEPSPQRAFAPRFPPSLLRLRSSLTVAESRL